MKMNNTNEIVEYGEFFKDYTFEELRDIAKFIVNNSKEDVDKLFNPYSYLFRSHHFVQNNQQFLENCILMIQMSFIDELLERVAGDNIICLPCNIGDTIYVYRYNTITNDFDIVTKTVKNVRYDAIDDTFMVSDGEFYREFGKKVFLTREEAENCLNER